MESRRAARTFRDFIFKNSVDESLFPALFSLNMLLDTDSGQAVFRTAAHGYVDGSRSEGH
jgi:hypothetical protein